MSERLRLRLSAPGDPTSLWIAIDRIVRLALASRDADADRIDLAALALGELADIAEPTDIELDLDDRPVIIRVATSHMLGPSDLTLVRAVADVAVEADSVIITIEPTSSPGDSSPWPPPAPDQAR